MKTYNCIQCGKESLWGRSKVNKYCSNACQGLFTRLTKTNPNIFAGKVSDPSTLKRFLIEEIGEYCLECGQDSIWNDKPLVLQLDHIDGNSDNNFPYNLRLLCPNCHTQTDTFGSKGAGNRYKKDTKRNEYLRNYKMPC
jgi:endogenous inhibitor of DNA gyrase (YacG/DUF329 family)